MTFQVGGLASGLDTKTIVDQLMWIESRPKTQLEWKSQLWTARKAAWSDLNARLLTLQNGANALMTPTTWNTAGATSVTSSDPAVSATGAPGTATPGTHTVQVSQLAQAQAQASTGALPGGLVPANDTLTITQGASSWNVAITSGDTLQQVADKINATTGIGVAATINGGGALELASTTTGAASGFSVSSTGTTAATLGFAQTTAAQDAQFSVDGAPGSSATNTGITGPIAGVALSFTAVTASPATLTVGAPSQAWVDATKKKVQDFVNQYNSVLDLVYQKTQGESRVASPKTLGDFLQGPVSHDTGYSSVAFDLRKLAGDFVTGLPAGASMLSDIGVNAAFSIGGGGANGRLSIDDTKLDAALRANPAQVQDMLGHVGATPGITGDDGIIRKLSEQVSMLRVGGRVDTAMNGAGSQVRSIQDAIDRQTTRLTKRKEYYDHMFASLESRLSKLQNQNNWLAGQLGSLQQSR